MAGWRAIAVALLLMSAPAWAQTSPAPQAPANCATGTEPACGPPPGPVDQHEPLTPPQPDWYLQKKCPAFVDCMPTWDKERAKRCEWVKKNCPNAQIVY